MGYLSRPYRVLYEAKNFRTGLTNVQAVVLKPDGSQLGPFAMPEMTGVFAGRYSFALTTSLSDPEGEYMVLIVSPSEVLPTGQMLQTTLRVSLYLPIDVAPLYAAIDDLNQAIAVLEGDIVTFGQQIDEVQIQIDELTIQVENVTETVETLEDLLPTIISLVVPPLMFGAVESDGKISAQVASYPNISGVVFDDEIAPGTISGENLSTKINDTLGVESELGGNDTIVGKVNDEGVLP